MVFQGLFGEWFFFHKTLPPRGLPVTKPRIPHKFPEISKKKSRNSFFFVYFSISSKNIISVLKKISGGVCDRKTPKKNFTPKIIFFPLFFPRGTFFFRKMECVLMICLYLTILFSPKIRPSQQKKILSRSVGNLAPSS